MAVPRRIAEGDALARSGKWQGWSPTGMLGHRINGKRLGIVGMGRIGEAVARRARGFGLSIHYHNRKPVHPETEAELEATYWESLDQMLARVDIVSVNCPHTPATNQLLSADRLSLMQSSAYIVNTSRGEVVDEKALADLLAQRHIAGAGLDVYSAEPDIPPGLCDLPNVVLLPHIGSATIEGRLQMGDKVIINVQTFWDGHTPPVLLRRCFRSRANNRPCDNARNAGGQQWLRKIIGRFAATAAIKASHGLNFYKIATSPFNQQKACQLRFLAGQELVL